MIRRSSRGISLTALIDVVFILLMFFMLTSSFSQFGFLEFQTADANGGVAGEVQVLLLLADGELVERSARQLPLSNEMLVNQIDAGRGVSLLPAADANVQTMLQAIERLNHIGFSKVTLGQIFPANDN